MKLSMLALALPALPVGFASPVSSPSQASSGNASRVEFLDTPSSHGLNPPSHQLDTRDRPDTTDPLRYNRCRYQRSSNGWHQFEIEAGHFKKHYEIYNFVTFLSNMASHSDDRYRALNTRVNYTLNRTPTFKGYNLRLTLYPFADIDRIPWGTRVQDGTHNVFTPCCVQVSDLSWNYRGTNCYGNCDNLDAELYRWDALRGWQQDYRQVERLGEMGDFLEHFDFEGMPPLYKGGDGDDAVMSRLMTSDPWLLNGMPTVGDVQEGERWSNPRGDVIPWDG